MVRSLDAEGDAGYDLAAVELELREVADRAGVAIVPVVFGDDHRQRDLFAGDALAMVELAAAVGSRCIFLGLRTIVQVASRAAQEGDELREFLEEPAAEDDEESELVKRWRSLRSRVFRDEDLAAELIVAAQIDGLLLHCETKSVYWQGWLNDAERWHADASSTEDGQPPLSADEQMRIVAEFSGDEEFVKAPPARRQTLVTAYLQQIPACRRVDPWDLGFIARAITAEAWIMAEERLAPVARRLRAEGKSLTAIPAILGVSRSNIEKWLAAG